MRKKYDVILKLIKSMIPFWNVIIFCYVWALFYNGQTASDFWTESMLISFFLYLLIYLAFGKLYHAFKIGTYRVGELIFSQLLAFGIADLCLYLECCMIHKGMVNLLPGLATVLVQFAGSLLFIILAKRYFSRYIPPQGSILIYGEQDASVQEFLQKLQSRLSHIFLVRETCKDSACVEELQRRMREYNTVLLYQVREEVRVRLLADCVREGKNIYVTPRIEDILLANFESRHMIDTPLLKARTEGSEYPGKRLLDIVLSSFMLLLFAPFMALIAAGIKLEDKGPVFYRQKRATKDGRIFEILKFRSMIPDAEKDGAKACTVDDDRITRMGKIIRATRLDEIPQLLNILKGDMSVVGPRPERVEHVEKYTAQLPEFSYRLRVRGGLTGYAQVYGKYNTSALDKLKMDLMYIERQSLLMDLQIIFLTLKIIFLPESTEGFQGEDGKICLSDRRE